MTASRPINAVLFDLDGTLLDTAPDFVHVLQVMCTRRGAPALSDAQVRATVSNGARALVELTFGLRPGDSDFEACLAELLDLYNDHLGDLTTAFQGIEPLLDALGQRSIAWGVVTNKPLWLAGPLMERMALQPPCATLVCPDHVRNRKPDPEPMLFACRELGVTPGNVLYIGDHRRDIDAGRAAGMHTIAAAWGYIGIDENINDWEADHIAATVTDSLDILLEHYL